ncbi:MAG: hypothetical protein GXX85_06150 [Ignavibacteria bacterium]|nr:hypothetical protein [Ignavibacteria bacterium]
MQRGKKEFEYGSKKNGLVGYRQTTSASQNACRRRNTGTSAVPRPVMRNLAPEEKRQCTERAPLPIGAEKKRQKDISLKLE